MSKKLVATALTIGNKESGYVFSLESAPHNMKTFEWRSHWRVTQTPLTCILFNKDKEFHSFGYESKDKFTELLENEDHADWYFFERFLQEVCMHYALLKIYN